MTHFTDVSMTNFMIMVTNMNYFEQNTISNSGPFLTISLGGQSPPPPPVKVAFPSKAQNSVLELEKLQIFSGGECPLTLRHHTKLCVTNNHLSSSLHTQYSLLIFCRCLPPPPPPIMSMSYFKDLVQNFLFGWRFCLLSWRLSPKVGVSVQHGHLTSMLFSLYVHAKMLAEN